MKKALSAIMVLIMVFMLTACSGSSGTSKKEEIFINQAQSYIDAGDTANAKTVIEKGLEMFPESEALKGLGEKLEKLEEEATSETTKAAKKLSEKGCYKGTYIPNFCDYAKATEIRQGSEFVGFRYETEGREIFDGYCEKLVKNGFVLKDHSEEYAEHYTYTLYSDESDTEEITSVYLSLAFCEDSQNTYQVVVETEDLQEYYNSLYSKSSDLSGGDYKVSTQNDALLVHYIPKQGSETFTKISKGKVVTVEDSVEGWALINFDGKRGWVSTDFLTPCGNGNNGGSNQYNGAGTVGDVVGGLVDQGLGIASGVINSIY